MLAIDVELLFGTIRAGSADDLAITGDGDAGEWPPSPARLLAALVAADGTGDRMRATTGAELALLEQADPPLVVADRELAAEEDPAVGRTGLLRSPQHERFVVVDANVRGSTVQEYPLRRAEAVRRAAVLAPRTPRITYLWPGVRPAPAELEGLRTRAARVGYFGCADSPVRLTVQVIDGDAPVEDLNGDGRAVWRPEDDGNAFIETPYPGQVDDLDRQFGAFTAGQWVRRAWLPSNRTSYRTPTPKAPAIVTPMPEVLWLNLPRSVAGRHALRLTEALRAATIAHLQDVRGPGADLPFEVTGHGAPTTEWDQVQFLALPNVGFRHSDGRIHGLAVAIPEGASPALVEDLRAAVSSILTLRLAGGREVPVERQAWGANTAAKPGRWRRPSRRFASAFPVVQDRFAKRGPSLDDVARWCGQAHLPPPLDARLHPLPFAPGAVVLRPHEAVRTGRERRPYTHLSMELGAPVRGPVAIGHLRSFGLGLLVPLDAREEGGGDG